MIRDPGNRRAHHVERVWLSPRDEKGLTMRDDAFGDGRDLGRTFAYTEDHFGEALAKLAVSIESREAKVLEWRSAQRAQDDVGGDRWIEGAAAHLIEQLLKLHCCHGAL